LVEDGELHIDLSNMMISSSQASKKFKKNGALNLEESKMASSSAVVNRDESTVTQESNKAAPGLPP